MQHTIHHQVRQITQEGGEARRPSDPHGQLQHPLGDTLACRVYSFPKIDACGKSPDSRLIQIDSRVCMKPPSVKSQNLLQCWYIHNKRSMGDPSRGGGPDMSEMAGFEAGANDGAKAEQKQTSLLEDLSDIGVDVEQSANFETMLESIALPIKLDRVVRAMKSGEMPARASKRELYIMQSIIGEYTAAYDEATGDDKGAWESQGMIDARKKLEGLLDALIEEYDLSTEPGETQSAAEEGGTKAA